MVTRLRRFTLLVLQIPVKKLVHRNVKSDKQDVAKESEEAYCMARGLTRVCDPLARPRCQNQTYWLTASHEEHQMVQIPNYDISFRPGALLSQADEKSH